MKKMIARAKTFQIPGLLLLAVPCACVTRAPTDYELDKRAGRAPQAASLLTSPMKVSATDQKSMGVPSRVQPVITPIWIYGHKQGDGSWMQGTWLFVESSPATWTVEGHR